MLKKISKNIMHFYKEIKTKEQEKKSMSFCKMNVKNTTLKKPKEMLLVNVIKLHSIIRNDRISQAIQEKFNGIVGISASSHSAKA